MFLQLVAADADASVHAVSASRRLRVSSKSLVFAFESEPPSKECCRLALVQFLWSGGRGGGGEHAYLNIVLQGECKVLLTWFIF
jgi:hypothetical protein